MKRTYLEEINSIKKIIDKSALQFLTAKKLEYSYSKKGGVKDKVFDRLSEFVTRGKSIRGTLFYYLALEFGCKNKKDITDFAVALELIHSALLIHDDIMDNDLLRRGKASIYAQYIDEIQTKDKKLAFETAKSIAISIGDLAIFLAFELFHNALKNNYKSLEIMSSLVKDYSLTGLGQIDDVFFSASDLEPSPEEISRVFLYKTARYTFSLPLTMAALFSGQEKNLVNNLDKAGEHMGIVFQMRDDEIGFFGESKEIGKTAGLDIIKNNKTLIRYFLYQKSSAKEKAELNKIFGNPKLLKRDIDRLKNLAMANGAALKIQELKLKNIELAKKEISKIKILSVQKSLNDLLIYLNNRNS